MFSNFDFLRFVNGAQNVYGACRNAELCYERIGSETAIRESRYALEVLLDFYISEKRLAYVHLGLAEKIDFVVEALKASGIFTQKFFDMEFFDYIRKFGNEMAHNSAIESSDYSFHREAIEVLQALQAVAIALVVDLDDGFLNDVEKYAFSNSYEIFDDVIKKNI